MAQQSILMTAIGFTTEPRYEESATLKRLSFSVGVNFREKQGDKDFEHVEYVRVDVVGERAAGLKSILTKGMYVSVTGEQRWYASTSAEKVVTPRYSLRSPHITFLDKKESSENVPSGAPEEAPTY